MQTHASPWPPTAPSALNHSDLRPLSTLSCSRSAIATGANGGLFGMGSSNNAISNASASTLIGNANANSAAIASGNGGMGGSNSAISNSNASSMFGSADASSVAIAGGK